ncbi:MAG: U32 family peptidase [Bacteroidales bacterium]|nr:U32 family peptidase [Bacteroidales bacterium]
MIGLELLAPARNADIGIAAIDCGADAVYIAGPEFGARQDAGNSLEDVRRLCEYAHRFGVRIFLTLNTILYDSELPEAERILHEAAEAGVDAIIAQDLAVFEILRKDGEILRFAQNDMEVHASTQCAIRTPEQARFYESLGASRIVLERQLSLEQIKAIRDAVSCELEFFVHGALCVCYSGQCYMSEAVAGRSANRGACVQACRSLYDLEDSTGKILVKDKALLSLKDYNLIGRLSDLAEAGICSFKIEGRLKNISYVRNTVRAYSKALDELVAAHPDKYRRASFGRVEGGFIPDLRKTFNRGYTELFIDGKRGKWSSMDAPKSVGEVIGTVINIRAGRPSEPGRVHSRFALRRSSGLAAAEYGLSSDAAPAKNMEVTVKLDNPATVLRNGDGFTFSPKDGGEIRGFRGDVCEGSRIICRDVPGLYVGARLRRNLSASFEKELETNLPTRRIPVSVSLVFDDPSATSAINVKAESEDGRVVEFDVDGGEQEATNRERMEAMFHSQIEKATGIYSFILTSLDSSGSAGKLPFMSASAINGIRREIAQRLDQMECGNCHPEHSEGSVAEEPVLYSESIDYKSNISNRVTREILQELGAKEIEDAFELTHRQGAELMRSKYCIRHELGLCLKDSSTSGPSSGSGQALRMTKGNLFLVNNGRRYRLGFDCARCEMTVTKA